jgi:hypothetical protein
MAFRLSYPNSGVLDYRNAWFSVNDGRIVVGVDAMGPLPIGQFRLMLAPARCVTDQ